MYRTFRIKGISSAAHHMPALGSCPPIRLTLATDGSSAIYSVQSSMPKIPNPAPRQFKIGDKIRVSLPGGKLVEGTIKSISEHKDGLRFQVAFRHDQTALIGEWQIVKD
jgi:hypothetical protein